jgi:hypothetical protein
MINKLEPKLVGQYQNPICHHQNNLNQFQLVKIKKKIQIQIQIT